MSDYSAENISRAFAEAKYFSASAIEAVRIVQESSRSEMTLARAIELYAAAKNAVARADAATRRVIGVGNDYCEQAKVQMKSLVAYIVCNRYTQADDAMVRAIGLLD